MVTFIIVCIVAGVVLAFVCAPIIMVANRQKLKEMDNIIAEYTGLLPDQRAARRPEYMAKLMDVKRGIWAGDKQSLEAARDKLSLI